MAFIKFNRKEAEKKANSFGEIPDGDYELLVTKAEWRPMLDKPDKTPNLNLELTVRSDVDQEGGGRKVFHTFYISRDPDKYENSMDFVNRFNLAINMPDEVEIETEEQWCDYVVGKPVKARLKTKPNTYNGKTTDRQEISFFSETEYTDVAHEMYKPSGLQPVSKQQSKVTKIEDDPFDPSNETIDISDDDLPF